MGIFFIIIIICVSDLHRIIDFVCKEEDGEEDDETRAL